MIKLILFAYFFNLVNIFTFRGTSCVHVGSLRDIYRFLYSASAFCIVSRSRREGEREGVAHPGGWLNLICWRESSMNGAWN